MNTNINSIKPFCYLQGGFFLFFLALAFVLCYNNFMFKNFVSVANLLHRNMQDVYVGGNL